MPEFYMFLDILETPQLSRRTGLSSFCITGWGNISSPICGKTIRIPAHLQAKPNGRKLLTPAKKKQCMLRQPVL
jgi:hypothetical protein